jgi:hypothetical protein
MSPTLYLAHVPGAQGDNVLLGQRGVARLPPESMPSLLISFVYLDRFLQKQKQYAYRSWALDSGAFTAHYSGEPIDLSAYIDTCKRLMGLDSTLAEIFSLDVIGDWKASLKNTEQMWKAGIPAIPAYHIGEPWEVLESLCRDYPKVALGGVALMEPTLKLKWAGQAFARVWPKALHGFGFGGQKAILAYPWHSVDATNWQTGACQYGRWQSLGGRMSVRGSRQDLKSEVEWFLQLERKARHKWKSQMSQLESESFKTAARRLQRSALPR